MNTTNYPTKPDKACLQQILRSMKNDTMTKQHKKPNPKIGYLKKKLWGKQSPILLRTWLSKNEGMHPKKTFDSSPIFKNLLSPPYKKSTGRISKISTGRKSNRRNLLPEERKFSQDKEGQHQNLKILLPKTSILNRQRSVLQKLIMSQTEKSLRT